jgi:hypothetical protein
MIVEERMYTFHVGQIPEWMVLYEREGLPILRRHLGNLLGAFVNDVGALNLVVQLWAYDSFDDREKRRAALSADPAWSAYRAKNQRYVLSQETRIMRPPAFLEPVLKAMLETAKGLSDRG